MIRLSTWSTLSTFTQSARPWICRECLKSQGPRPTANFSTSQYFQSQAGKRAWRNGTRYIRERRKVAIATTTIFVAGAGALAFSEQARFAYVSAERSGRVVVTLGLCVRDYLKTLKKHEDPKYDALLSACHKRCAERTLLAMEKNGSIFIKLGQHLSSLNYLLPSEWCDTFIPLQDQCPVSSYTSIEEMVKQDTGKTLEDYFETFEAKPVGAASLAQVHIATMKATGEKVAVKVQHPALDYWARLDLALTRFSFRTLKYFFPEYDLTWLSEEMEVSLPKELDFREEGRNAMHCKAYFSSVPNTPLVIPDVLWAERRILVMQYITGARPDDLEYLDSHNIDRDEVSAALSRIFNEMIFGHNAPLHCDPHGGNLAVRLKTPDSPPHPQNFDIILYDHGLYRDIPAHLRRAYAHLWLAVIESDEPAMRHYAHTIAGITDEEFPLFASAITGRDYSTLRNPAGSGVTSNRSEAEKENITNALGDGLIEQLVGLLSRVPRVILLILKTNDLTRSLDENLQTRQGPVRTFMILARYAARSVFEESVEGIRGSLLWPSNAADYLLALAKYARVAGKLRVYEMYLQIRRRLGLEASVI
ncbi:hypothetical protein MBLNU230_g5684t1 [Neophaeotheca triangularis]